MKTHEFEFIYYIKFQFIKLNKGGGYFGAKEDRIL